MPSSPAPVPVAVAHGRDDVRTAVVRALTGDPAIQVAGQARDLTGVLEIVASAPVQVLLIGAHLPEAGALGAIRAVSAKAPQTAIIVLSTHTANVDLTLAVVEGARGIVRQDAPDALLRKCVMCVAAGEYWVTREQVGTLATRLRHPVAAPESRRFDALSAREIEIVGAVVRGASNKDIASSFTLSEQTVKNHLANVFRKVGVQSRLELALAAIQRGLVQGPAAATPRSDDEQRRSDTEDP